MNFVLDASVALSWLLEDAGAAQDYANSVFDMLKVPPTQAHVPVTWGLEVANVIAKCEARGLLLERRSRVFLAAIDAAPIACDSQTHEAAFSATLQLCRRHRLSSYDASYLELAMRTALPLATLDQDLRRAAAKTGVKVFKPI
ncbi:MAG: type II toxin-antitoxin system VapC family toxin [Gammaproteobacteria bacterium]|nr:type II toxin-antitoxin system VapC family toxin [Gammaproteobacteria bacterium]